jgi:hypothetical protein
LAGDLGPWYPTAGTTWDYFTNAWSNTNLGWVNPLIFGLAAVQIPLTFLFGDAATAQRFFFLSLMPLSIVTMYLLLRYLVLSSSIRILVALAYGINAWSITWFTAGGHPSLSVHAAFPLIFLFFLKFLRETDHRLRNLLVFTALVSLEAGIMPYLLIRISPILLLAVALQYTQQRSVKWLKTVAVGVGAAGVVYFLLTLPLSLTLLGLVWDAMWGASGGTTGLAGGIDIAQTSETAVVNYNTDFSYRQLVYALGMVVALVLLSRVVRPGPRRLWYLGMVLMASLVLTGMYSISLGATKSLFISLPFLLPFQDPDKLQSMMLQPAFLAVAFMLDDVARRTISPTSRRSLRRHIPVLLGAVIAGLGLFFIMTEAHPPLDNPVTNLHRFVTTGFNQGSGEAFELPQAYSSAVEWVKKRHEQEGYFRTLWLPGDRYVERNVLPILDPQSFRHPDDRFLRRLVMEPLFTGDTNQFGHIVGEFSVKYIIVVDPQWEWGVWQRNAVGPPRYIEAADQGFVSIGDPAAYKESLERQTDLELVHSSVGFSVFRNRVFQPHISAYSNSLAVVPLGGSAQATSADTVGVGGGNLLQNGSFTDELTHWTTDNSPGAEYNVITDGSTSTLVITVANKPLFGAVIQTVPASGAEIYALTVQARGENAIRASFKVFYQDANGQPIMSADGAFQRLWFDIGQLNTTTRFVLEPPPKTRSIRLHVEATSGEDTEAPASTWLDSVALRNVSSRLLPPASNVDVVGLYGERGEGLGAQLVEIPLLLTKLPFINLDNTLLRLADLEEGSPADIAASVNTTVFLGNPENVAEMQAWVDPSRPFLVLMEAESVLDLSIPPLKADAGAGTSSSIMVENEDYAYLGALELQGQQQATFQINLPLSGLYRVAIRGRLTAPFIYDGVSQWKAVPVTQHTNGIQWFQTKATPLPQGVSSLSIGYAGDTASIDQLALLYVPHPELSFQQVLSSRPITLDVTELNFGKFAITVSSQAPYTLLFREAYSPSWEARSDGRTLLHTSAGSFGWANAFIAPHGGAQELTLEHTAQGNRHAKLTLWAASWIVVMVLIAGLSLAPLSKEVTQRWRARTEPDRQRE